MDLPDHLDAEQDEDPDPFLGDDPERIPEGHDRPVVGDLGPHEHEEDERQQDDELQPVPERHLLARLGCSGAGGCSSGGRQAGGSLRAAQRSQRGVESRPPTAVRLS